METLQMRELNAAMFSSEQPHVRPRALQILAAGYNRCVFFRVMSRIARFCRLAVIIGY